MRGLSCATCRLDLQGKADQCRAQEEKGSKSIKRRPPLAQRMMAKGKTEGHERASRQNTEGGVTNVIVNRGGLELLAIDG